VKNFGLKPEFPGRADAELFSTVPNSNAKYADGATHAARNRRSNGQGAYGEDICLKYPALHHFAIIVGGEGNHHPPACSSAGAFARWRQIS